MGVALIFTSCSWQKSTFPKMSNHFLDTWGESRINICTGDKSRKRGEWRVESERRGKKDDPAISLWLFSVWYSRHCHLPSSPFSHSSAADHALACVLLLSSTSETLSCMIASGIEQFCAILLLCNLIAPGSVRRLESPCTDPRSIMDPNSYSCIYYHRLRV